MRAEPGRGLGKGQITHCDLSGAPERIVTSNKGQRNMTHWIILWIVAAILFLAIDMVWLLWLGRSFYVSEIGDLLRQPPNMAAAGAFYVLYVTGLMIMVIWPGTASRIGLAGAHLWRPSWPHRLWHL